VVIDNGSVIKGGRTEFFFSSKRGDLRLYIRQSCELELGSSFMGSSFMKFPRVPISHLVYVQLLGFLIWVTRFGRTKP